MTYVELNPIRANMASTPEISEYTPIKQRIGDHQQSHKQSVKGATIPINACVPLKSFLSQGDYLKDKIPYYYQEHLELADWSGRTIRKNKSAVIDDQLPSILIRLSIDAKHCCQAMQPKGVHRFSRAVGCRDNLRAYATKLNIRWIKGINLSAKLFPT
ncbi:MAG: hypothetical protein V7784_11900 [Oceanospirillaceae bacterium]